jgi:aspartyl-tRNA(Asn)/glutamyl-tRNA(Gln) amidotransferase subunit C
MDIKDVENLAKLARIELGEDEKKVLLSDMKSILGYVEQIKEMKVDGAVPEFPVYNAWREDALDAREFSKDLITSQFPDSQDHFLKVKKIL